MRYVRTIVSCAFTALACSTETHRSDAPRSVASDTASASLSRDAIVRARRAYKVRVLSFDASQEFGTEAPYADLVRLKIVNHSDVKLPCLTVLTKRYAKGQMVGGSRRPSIPTGDLAPGDSVEYD